MFHTLKTFLCDCFNGKAKLWQAFWLLSFLGGMLLAFIFIGILVPFGLDPMGIFAMIYQLLMMAFHVFCIISIWRCAPNSEWIGWMYIARVLAVLTAIAVAISLFGMLL